MPGTLKVKVVSARGLPVMDRSTDLTDAFVEVCLSVQLFYFVFYLMFTRSTDI